MAVSQRGDEVILGAVVNNNTDEDLEVEVSLAEIEGLDVADDLAQTARQVGDDLRHPFVEEPVVRTGERELKLRAAHAILDREVLDGLHGERDPGQLGDPRLQAADHLGGACVALGKRLQVDEQTARIERRVDAIHTDEGRQALHRGIFEDDACERAHDPPLECGRPRRPRPCRSHGYARDVRFRSDKVQKILHQFFRVEQAFIHADVYDLRAVCGGLANAVNGASEVQVRVAAAHKLRQSNLHNHGARL